MTNQEIKTIGQTIAQETQIGGNTAARVGGVVEGIGVALDNKDAANGYYQATISGGTITVNAPNYLLDSGGNLRIKMPSAGTTASTLTIGNANAVQLWYNGAAVSAQNTWEANEIISVFYDGTRFMASNSQGGGGKAEKIKYDNSQSGLVAENVQGALDVLVYETDVIESSVVIDENSCVRNSAIRADGTIQTNATTEYYISNYIEIPSKANRIVHSGIRNYTANLSYGCLYDSSKNLLYRFQGDGIIDLANYPSAKYVVIGINTNLTDINPVVEIQSVVTPNEASVIDTRHDVVLHNQNECVIVGVISATNGVINTNISDTSYHISDYIDLEGYDYCHHSLWNKEGGNFAGAALYDESHNPVKALVGEGLIYLKDYPSARYIVIAIHNTHKRVNIELGKGYRTSVKSLAEKIPMMEDAFMYKSGKGIQWAGNIDTAVDNNSENNYYAMGVADSAAEYDGTITSVSFNAQNTGTINFMVGVWDETHEYFHRRSTHTYSVTNKGNQTLSVSIPILQGETLMVNMSSGVKVKFKNYSSSVPPVGSKNAIISVDGGQIYHKYGPLRTYLSWTIAWEFEQTLKEKVTENANDIEAVENECGKIGQQVSELANSKLLIQGDDGKVYRLVVTDGILGIENTTPQNILILAHSFGCILTGVWHRGMSSSKIATDWISQMNTVFLPNIVNRVNMVAWEQAFPNPSSQLSSLNSYLTTSVDAIFIMCGANVASAYRTQQYGQTNFAALVNYCKERATNADIYVCSPGYTPETDGFNIGIKAGAESAGATYISTYSTQADKLANFGDVVWDANNNEYSFVINSNGRVNHPSDIWHLYMANNILSSLGYSTLDKYRSISCNASVSYRGHTRWVAGGHCTFCTFGGSQPTVSIVDANNNPINFEIMDLSGVTWENTPQSIPKWAVHFDMPDSNVIITIS